MTQTNQNKDYSWLEPILDAHAETYARATMKFITNELSEAERDKEFHHSDLKTKHAIQSRIDEHYIGKGEAEPWHSVNDSMPKEDEFVLARLEWPSGKEVYSVLQYKVLEDNAPWLCDGDELSFSVNVTHWRYFEQLSTNNKDTLGRSDNG